MSAEHRGNRGVLALCACVLGLGIAFLALHIVGPSDGTHLEPDAPSWTSSGIVVTPLGPQASGGLQPGDLVVAVAGRTLDGWSNLLVDPGISRPTWHVGDVVTYTVLRHGHVTQVPVILVPFDIGANVREEWGSLVFALAFALIAGFVFLRRPQDRSARALFVSTCCLLSAQSWSFGLQISDVVGGLGFWLYQFTALGAYTLFWAALLHFTLLFPRPHRLVVRWRWLIPAIYIGPAIYWVVFLIATRAISATTLAWIGTWTPGQGITGIIYFAATLLLAFDALRTSRDPITSRQIRWVVFAGVLSGGTGLLLSILPGDVFGHAIISTNVLGLVLLPIPLALAFAILRYHLFDIDVIINRALVYGTLSMTLALVYAASVIALQTVVGWMGGPATGWPPAIVVSTLLIVALFQPLRRRVQGAIDRRFYRRKYDAERTVAAFGELLRAQTELEDLMVRLVDVVRETMQPSSISLWLANPSQARATSDREHVGQ